MKRLLLNITLLLWGLFLSPVVSALGIGPIQIQSNLNQPLLAAIPLNQLGDLDESQIKIGLADPSYFTKAGIYRAPWLSELKYEVIKHSEEKGIINIRSTKPIKDPVVDILINIAWPTGKVVRQYTILLDPQDMVLQSPMARVRIPRPYGSEFSSQPKSYQNKTAVSMNQNGQSQNLAMAFGGEYGPVGDEDTLWQIAHKLVNNTKYSVSQGVIAIYEKNRDLFPANNLNKIAVGSMLVLPTESELGAIEPQVARNKINQFTQRQTQQASASTTYTSPIEQKPLKILSADPNSLTSKKKPSENFRLEDSETEKTEILADKISLLEEAIDTLKRRNEDVTEQNAFLQKNYQRLFEDLSEKDKQIIALKQAQNTIVQKPLQEDNTERATIPSNGDTIQNTQVEMTKVGATTLPATSSLPVVDEQSSGFQLPSSSPLAVPAQPLQTQATSNWVWIMLFALAIGGTVMAFFYWRARQKDEVVVALDSQPVADNHPQKTSESSTFFEKIQNNDHNNDDVVNYGMDIDLDKTLTDVNLNNQTVSALHSEAALNAKFDFEAVKRKYAEALEEAEIAVAYEHYHKAEEILIDVLEQAPNHWQALLKLLELYVLTENYQQFKVYRAKIPSNLHEVDMEIWSKLEFLIEKYKQETLDDGDVPQEETALDIKGGVAQSSKSTDRTRKQTQDEHTIPEYKVDSDLEEDIDSILTKQDTNLSGLSTNETKTEPAQQRLDDQASESVEALETKSVEAGKPSQTEETSTSLEFLTDDLPNETDNLKEVEAAPHSESQVSPFNKESIGTAQTAQQSFVHLNQLGEDTQSLIELAKAFIGAREFDSAKGLLHSLMCNATQKQTQEIEHLLASIK